MFELDEYTKLLLGRLAGIKVFSLGDKNEDAEIRLDFANDDPFYDDPQVIYLKKNYNYQNLYNNILGVSGYYNEQSINDRENGLGPAIINSTFQINVCKFLGIESWQLRGMKKNEIQEEIEKKIISNLISYFDTYQQKNGEKIDCPLSEWSMDNFLKYFKKIDVFANNDGYEGNFKSTMPHFLTIDYNEDKNFVPYFLSYKILNNNLTDIDIVGPGGIFCGPEELSSTMVNSIDFPEINALIARNAELKAKYMNSTNYYEFSTTRNGIVRAPKGYCDEFLRFFKGSNQEKISSFIKFAEEALNDYFYSPGYTHVHNNINTIMAFEAQMCEELLYLRIQKCVRKNGYNFVSKECYPEYKLGESFDYESQTPERSERVNEPDEALSKELEQALSLLLMPLEAEKQVDIEVQENKIDSKIQDVLDKYLEEIDDDEKLKKKEIRKLKKQFPNIDFEGIDLEQIKFKDENGKEYQFTPRQIREIQEQKLHPQGTR